MKLNLVKPSAMEIWPGSVEVQEVLKQLVQLFLIILYLLWFPATESLKVMALLEIIQKGPKMESKNGSLILKNPKAWRKRLKKTELFSNKSVLTGIKCSWTRPSLRCFPCRSLRRFFSYSRFSRFCSRFCLRSCCRSSFDFFRELFNSNTFSSSLKSETIAGWFSALI